MREGLTGYGNFLSSRMLDKSHRVRYIECGGAAPTDELEVHTSMNLSWPHQSLTRRRTLVAAAGLAAGALVPPGPALAVAAQYTNPVIWQDFADIDIIRVGDTYYASASTMHYSPGAPVLRSYDLVNWEIAGHSVPVLDFGAKYDLNGTRGYVRGIWASSLAYRPSNRTFYWLGQIDFARTYLYTATAVEGPWNRLTTINTPYYDAGLLVDTDDTQHCCMTPPPGSASSATAVRHGW